MKREKGLKGKESEIVTAILKYLQYRSIFCWRNNNTPIFDPTRQAFRRMPKYTMKGISDILGILPTGRLLAIEVKREGKYPTREQKEFMDHVSKRGGLAFVARSIDDVKARL